jgi:hypothetical protein
MQIRSDLMYMPSALMQAANPHLPDGISEELALHLSLPALARVLQYVPNSSVLNIFIIRVFRHRSQIPSAGSEHT